MEHNTENTQQDAQGQNGADKSKMETSAMPVPAGKKKCCGIAVKIILGIVLFLLIVVIVDVVLHFETYKAYFEGKRNFREYAESQRRIIAEDVYGGDTPEETYNMFREAMLNKDIETALLYVDPFQREVMRKFLDKKNQNNSLDEYLEKDLPPIENLKKEIKDNYIRFKYLKEEPAKILNDDGKTTSDSSITIAHYIELVQNSITKKWKILSPVINP